MISFLESCLDESELLRMFDYASLFLERLLAILRFCYLWVLCKTDSARFLILFGFLVFLQFFVEGIAQVHMVL